MHLDSSSAYRYESWYNKRWGRKFDKLEKKLLLKSIKGNEEKTLLEIGCGTGHFTRWFQSLGMKTVGIDISREMLSAARDLAADSIPLIEGKAEYLPVKTGAFDIVAMITTLEFIAQPERALLEAYRAAKHKILLGVLNTWSPINIYRRLKRIVRKSSYRGAHFYSATRLRALISHMAQQNNVVLGEVKDIRKNGLFKFFTCFFLLEVGKAC
jgi:ubiquinone/menaquinone biosynthesis C-methylase UbiE